MALHSLKEQKQKKQKQEKIKETKTTTVISTTKALCMAILSFLNSKKDTNYASNIKNDIIYSIFYYWSCIARLSTITNIGMYML